MNQRAFYVNLYKCCCSSLLSVLINKQTLNNPFLLILSTFPHLCGALGSGKQSGKIIHVSPLEVLCELCMFDKILRVKSKILKGFHGYDTNCWCCCCSWTSKTLTVACACQIHSLFFCPLSYLTGFMALHWGTQVQAIGEVYCHISSTLLPKRIRSIRQ